MMMKADANQPDFYRSEAFAEDVIDLVATVPAIERAGKRVTWPAKAVRAALALIGVASTRRRRESESRRPSLARPSLT
jgi:hypothetical protein